MKNTVVKVLIAASVLSPVPAFAQAGKTAPHPLGPRKLEPS
jgi:hypothetical protein